MSDLAPSMISAAQERGIVKHNVARDVKLRRSERHHPDRVFPTKEEIRALVTNALERHEPLIMTALFTGMRMSELRGLSWGYGRFPAKHHHREEAR
ncbi:hypothetical protein [Porphyrobacter sp. CACIAM 03H1]|uniref:hypothetical protein n=1 Tax=Porphyrobacter sp. CACIAM 03H1 TaxID=2003315 RepID=UPI0012FD5983|nr:hypothetical protein [Porphyrobacter sp. CACIAM 03H1]